MAGEANVKLAQSVQFGLVTIGGTTQAIAVNNPNQFSQRLPADSIVEVDIGFTRANVAVLAMEADQDCVVHANDNGDPDGTVNLTARVPWVWKAGDPVALSDIFAADVTKLYVVTPDSGTDLLFKVGVGSDITP